MFSSEFVLSYFLCGTFFYIKLTMYRNMSKSMRNDTFPSVSKMSYGQSDKTKSSKHQVTKKTDWATK